MATEVYITIEGRKQGKIEGDVTKQGLNGKIAGYALDHSVEVPFDAKSGVTTGQRAHRPLTITTEIGKHTPKLFQACADGEHLDVTIDFYQTDANTGQLQKYYTVSLKDATVVNIGQSFPETFLEENKQYTHMNTISFAYKQIVWNNVKHSVETEDNWNAPKLG